MTPEKTHDSLREEYEEQLYEIISEVRIPNHKDWGGGEKMSLFDITMDEGEDEEGIVLVNKLLTFIDQIHDSAYSAGIKSGLEMAVGCVPEEIKRPFTLNRSQEVWNEACEDSWNDCRSAVLSAMKGLKGGGV